MRADRLISMIMILQHRGKVTAAELAHLLEVSERTVYRDMVALSSAGVPIYSEKGPGGGICLVESYQTSLTGLTAEEAQALFMLNVPESMGVIGASKELESALMKLAASLPRYLKSAEFDVRQRMLIDAEYAFSAREEASSALIDLHQAVWNDQLIQIDLQYMFGVVLSREVEPYSLVASGGKWFLIGRSDGVYWSVLVDQIVNLEILDAKFRREPAFDLKGYWGEWKTRMQEDIYPYTAIIFVDIEIAQDIRYFEGVKIIDCLEDDLAGWSRMVLGFQHLFKAREWVMKFGGAVRVQSPEALKLSVIDFAQRTLEVYEHSD